jgi:hypothetical protein
MPDELREWASDTMTALMAGLVIGGGKKYLEERGAGLALLLPLLFSVQ